MSRWDDAELDALQQHPECKYAESVNGLAWDFSPTIVVKLWRTAECAAAGDPPRHIVEGYPAR
jgi:hypothetical protein